MIILRMIFFIFFYFLGKLPISFEVHPNMIFFVRFGELLKAKLGVISGKNITPNTRGVGGSIRSGAVLAVFITIA